MESTCNNDKNNSICNNYFYFTIEKQQWNNNSQILEMQISRSMRSLSRLDKHPSYTTTSLSVARFNMPIEYLHYHVLHVIPRRRAYVRGVQVPRRIASELRDGMRRAPRGPETNIDDVGTPQTLLDLIEFVIYIRDRSG